MFPFIKGCLDHTPSSLQVLCEQDKKAIEYFAQHYEIDFISLSYTRSKEDLLEAREFADRVGLATTKVRQER